MVSDNTDECTHMYPEFLEDLAMGHRCNEQFMDQFSTQRVGLLHSLPHSQHISLTCNREGGEGEREEGEMGGGERGEGERGEGGRKGRGRKVRGGGAVE